MKQRMKFRFKFIKHDLWLLLIWVVCFSTALFTYIIKDYLVSFFILTVLSLVGVEKIGQLRYYYQFDGWKKE